MGGLGRPREHCLALLSGPRSFALPLALIALALHLWCRLRILDIFGAQKVPQTL